MNYRHAYHAGNHADILKHVVLTLLLEHLNQKEKPYTVLDAHAGVGIYDLRGTEAVKTGEWRSGYGLMNTLFDDQVENLLQPWRKAVETLQKASGNHVYPGSPTLTVALLRPFDRLICNELHPQDFEQLEKTLGHDPRVRITRRDFAQSIKAELPPNPKRGLVLIDPPYEDTNETSFALKALSEGYRRFTVGTFLLWYPVKGSNFSDQLLGLARDINIPNMLSCELRIQESFDGGGLAGSGLIIINPPWQFDEKLELLVAALAQRLGRGTWGKGLVKWLTAKKA